MLDGSVRRRGSFHGRRKIQARSRTSELEPAGPGGGVRRGAGHDFEILFGERGHPCRIARLMFLWTSSPVVVGVGSGWCSPTTGVGPVSGHPRRLPSPSWQDELVEENRSRARR